MTGLAADIVDGHPTADPTLEGSPRAHLPAALDAAWALLATGVRDRHSLAHTPVVATLGTDGEPRQRVMVLRRAERPTRSLTFHTDRRSDKVGEFARDDRVSVLIYDPRANTQLRLDGCAAITGAGPTVDASWETSTLWARRCYLADPAPGRICAAPTSGLPSAVEGRTPTEAETLPGRINFARLDILLHGIEWLHLAHDGHRRARFRWTGADWAGVWLAP